MPDEARLEQTENGLVPSFDGWFVVNAADTPWWQSEYFGASTSHEGKLEFPEYGMNIHVLWPGQPNGLYHRESVQEDFLVVSGECLVLIEGEERRLKPWDFVHCPAGTDHIFVGAGEGPCVIVLGARRDERAERRLRAVRPGRGRPDAERRASGLRSVYATFSNVGAMVSAVSGVDTSTASGLARRTLPIVTAATTAPASRSAAPTCSAR